MDQEADGAWEGDVAAFMQAFEQGVFAEEYARRESMRRQWLLEWDEDIVAAARLREAQHA